MKTKLSFYLALLIPILFFAQDYQPMLVEGNYWDVGYYDHDSPCPVYPETRYVLGNDIDVNGVIYKQIEVHTIIGTEDGMCYTAPFNVESSYVISDKYIREDIAEKKVYIWADNLNGNYQEYLLYDFNLEVGDTFNPYSEEGTWTVTDIDYTNDGAKIYEFGGVYSFTEGIGGNAGIISKFISQFEYYDELVCNGNYNAVNTCTAVASTNNNFIDNINIYPNPIKNTINIDSILEFEFLIYSLDGKEIKKGNTQNTIDVNNIKSGIYLLKLISYDKQTTKKIIVK